MIDLYQAVKAILETERIGVHDEILQTPGRPYYLLKVATPRPVHARADFSSVDGSHWFYVQCVSNSPVGCRFLADRAMNLLDGVRLEERGDPVVMRDSTLPDLDEGPGDFRWSAFLSFAVHLRR